MHKKLMVVCAVITMSTTIIFGEESQQIGGKAVASVPGLTTALPVTLGSYGVPLGVSLDQTVTWSQQNDFSIGNTSEKDVAKASLEIDQVQKSFTVPKQGKSKSDDKAQGASGSASDQNNKILDARAAEEALQKVIDCEKNPSFISNGIKYYLEPSVFNAAFGNDDLYRVIFSTKDCNVIVLYRQVKPGQFISYASLAIYSGDEEHGATSIEAILSNERIILKSLDKKYGAHEDYSRVPPSEGQHVGSREGSEEDVLVTLNDDKRFLGFAMDAKSVFLWAKNVYLGALGGPVDGFFMLYYVPEMGDGIISKNKQALAKRKQEMQNATTVHK